MFFQPWSGMWLPLIPRLGAHCERSFLRVNGCDSTDYFSSRRPVNSMQSTSPPLRRPACRESHERNVYLGCTCGWGHPIEGLARRAHGTGLARGATTVWVRLFWTADNVRNRTICHRGRAASHQSGKGPAHLGVQGLSHERHWEREILSDNS